MTERNREERHRVRAHPASVIEPIGRRRLPLILLGAVLLRQHPDRVRNWVDLGTIHPPSSQGTAERTGTREHMGCRSA